MVVRGQEGVGVDDRQGAGPPVDVHPLAAPRWVAPETVDPCQATAVPMAVVLPMPNLGVMAAVIATDARRGMVAGSGLGVAIGPEIGLEIGPEIDPATGSVINPQIVLESASEIAPESALEIAPVPLTEIRTPSVRSLRTIAQVPDVSGIGTIVMAIDVVPGMNGASPPSAPVRATTMVVPLDRMQLRRPQRPHLQRMT